MIWNLYNRRNWLIAVIIPVNWPELTGTGTDS
jgi:hypothetical protein